MRLPGGAALHCWGGGAAQTAYSGTADGSLVTKVNHFYNGMRHKVHSRDMATGGPALALISVMTPAATAALMMWWRQ